MQETHDILNCGADHIMKKTPISVSVTLILLLINAFVWLVFAIIVGTGLHPGIPKIDLVKWVYTSLSVLATAVLTCLWFYLRRQSRVAYYLTLASLAFVCILTFFDDFGLADIIFLIIPIAPLVLLIKDRAWYLQRNPTTPR